MSPATEAYVEELFSSLRRYSFAWMNLIGIDRWTEWTPVRTGWTDTGTPTVTGRYRQVGRKCEFQAKVVPGTDVATTAGTSYITLPLNASGLGGGGIMYNSTTNIAVGTCAIDVTNSRIYVPSQTASGNTFIITGWFETL